MEAPIVVLLCFALIGALVGAVGSWIWLSEKLVGQDALIDQNALLRNQLHTVESRLAIAENRLRNADEVINQMAVKVRTH